MAFSSFPDQSLLAFIIMETGQIVNRGKKRIITGKCGYTQE